MPSFRRPQVKQSAQMSSKTATFLAPIRGWVDSENLASHGPNAATVLENFFPTTRGIRIRGGSKRHATVNTTDGVKSLMVWRSGGNERLFATDLTAIYNITTPADPNTPPAADVSGLTSGGMFSSVMFANVSGEYLVYCNGANGVRTYNGTVHADQTGSITGTGGAVNTFSHVWVFKNRLFFVQKNTMQAWCLPVDSIGGAATQVSLSGVFQRGGSLMFGDTWSVDAGSGQNDLCVFVSTAGEVVVFQGTDPANAFSWSMLGRYDIGRPLGPNAKFRAGGDLIIATQDGLVPLSAAQTKDPAALNLVAITRPIEISWRTEAVRRESSSAWSCLKLISRDMAIVGLPAVSPYPTEAWVANLLTGAWCKFTGWNISCQADMVSQGYFGSPDGRVYQMEATGKDDTAQYLSTCVGLFDNLKRPASQKTATMARSTWIYTKPFTAKISASFDYRVTLPAYPSAASHPSLDEWDVGLWDVALWDSGEAERVITGWVSVAGEGFTVAPNVQVTNSHISTPSAELVSIDLLYEDGGVSV
jgi:hypothetical protein